MVRLILITLLSVVALAGCDSLRDYRVRVKDPTQRSVVNEPPYYDYKRRETVYSR